MKTMEYNSSRDKLLLPEYGRNVQQMVNYLLTVEDREKRTQLAHAVVSVMGILNPNQRDVADFKQKLWDHLFIISGFKLDVDAPYPKPSEHTIHAKPKKVAYPYRQIKYMHYGRNTELVIEQIKKTEDPEKKEVLTMHIANFMKMSYLNWNRDSVNDEQIAEQLRTLSGGALTLGENTKLIHSSELIAKTGPASQPQHKKQHNRNKNMRRNNGGYKKR